MSLLRGHHEVHQFTDARSAPIPSRADNRDEVSEQSWKEQQPKEQGVQQEYREHPKEPANQPPLAKVPQTRPEKTKDSGSSWLDVASVPTD